MDRDSRLEHVRPNQNFSPWEIHLAHVYRSRRLLCKPADNFTDKTTFFIFTAIGKLFYLNLILFGTKKDPLSNNPHVDRSTKKVERVDVQQRKKGKLCRKISFMCMTRYIFDISVFLEGDTEGNRMNSRATWHKQLFLEANKIVRSHRASTSVVFVK